MESAILGKGLWSAAEEEQFIEAREQEFAALVAEVEVLPSRCLIASMFDDVYAERPWHLDEQLAELDEEVQRHGEKTVRL